jgi:imidazolonepropionase
MSPAAKSATPPLLLANIGQLLTLRGDNAPRRGRALSELGIVENAAVLCAGGKIVAAGRQRDVQRHPVVKRRKRIGEIDCGGKVVLPGFVDSHTHPVFTAPRLVDFEKRVGGATYEQIAEAGGGIRSSMAGVRQANKAALAKRVVSALEMMAAQGTTTVEAKSGYGLSAEAEIKSLEALRMAAQHWPGTLVPTLLAAHVVPPEFHAKPRRYVQMICEELIPAVARRDLAAFVDVYCDRGAFTIGDAQCIFAEAQEFGLGVRAHVCQLTRSTIEPLLKFDPASFDHLDCVDDWDIAALAQRGTVATLLPGASFFLGLSYAPARKLIEAGVAVALATDYNPGTSPTTSMPFVLSLACTQMKMSPAEAIAAATINGACALRLQERKGGIEPGKDADLAVFDVRDYREVPYWLAANQCSAVIVGGRLLMPQCEH